MCGIVGIQAQVSVASEIYDSLIHLQHRGQDAAGIITYDFRMHKEKGLGLVRDIFNENKMNFLTGNVGIGHTRYPTHGGFGHGEIQPFWTEVPYGIALGHNGNLVNYKELAEEITDREKRYLNTTSDTEVLLHMFASALGQNGSAKSDKAFFEQICGAVKSVFDRTNGSFSVVAAIVGKGLVAFRDPHGIRPLSRGERKSDNGSIDNIFSSETTMFHSLEFEPKGTVEPGEVYYVSEAGKVFSKKLVSEEFTPCIFEYVYFSRPDTMMNDVSVYRSRLRMGQNLAKRWLEKHPDVLPDIVIPAPSTANTAALSLAYEIGVRYSEGLYKNPFIGRTFIMPGQAERKKSIRHKLVPQETEIRDKKVMIVDDSIVRGNTSRQIVRIVKDMGAKEVYFVTTCPPVKNPCFYGVDMPTRSELIAAQKSVDEIQAYIGVDILLYQEIPDLVEAVTRRGDHNIDRPCMACLDGWYVSGNVDEAKMSEMETMRLNDRNGE